MRHNRINVAGRAACAVALSLVMAAGSLVDGLAVAPFAYAAEGENATGAEAPLVDSADDSQAAEEGAGGHVSQEVPLEAPDTPADDASETDVADASEASAPVDEEEKVSSEGDRVTADVPLVEEETPAATAGAVIVDGLKYQVNPDGKTAELAGWHGAAAPEGDVTIAARVVSGADEYAVTKVAKEALKGCDKVESVVLPDTLVEIGKDAFAGCAALRSIVVGETNEKYTSHDGMLFSKDLATLVLCPEGKGSGGGFISLFAS